MMLAPRELDKLAIYVVLSLPAEGVIGAPSSTILKRLR
jgi:hypothetical protein